MFAELALKTAVPMAVGNVKNVLRPSTVGQRFAIFDTIRRRQVELALGVGITTKLRLLVQHMSID